MTDVVIAAAARTAIGSYGKSLRDVPPTELGAHAARAALDRAGVAPADVEHVVFGNVIHTAPEDMYMARVVGMKAGLAQETPAFTVNRLCGSGVQAIVSATQAIQSGDVDVALAGGAESMSRAPYWLPSARWGSRMGDATAIDPVSGALTDPFHEVLMGVTAENLAARYDISREDQDAFAVESHRRAAEATAAGRLADEIAPLTLKSRRESVEFAADEHIRHPLTTDALAALKPVFQRDGTVTAGNASGMNDAGAAAVLLSAHRAQELGVEIRARILAYASCGVDPAYMGIGPVPAIGKALKRAGLSLGDIGVFELNEAFAAQAIAVIRELDLDPERVNPNGGAIALGHPIGATGAVITAKAIAEMHRAGHEHAIVSLCIGGGQGIALVLGR